MGVEQTIEDYASAVHRLTITYAFAEPRFRDQSQRVIDSDELQNMMSCWTKCPEDRQYVDHLRKEDAVNLPGWSKQLTDETFLTLCYSVLAQVHDIVKNYPPLQSLALWYLPSCCEVGPFGVAVTSRPLNAHLHVILTGALAAVEADLKALKPPDAAGDPRPSDMMAMARDSAVAGRAATEEGPTRWATKREIADIAGVQARTVENWGLEAFKRTKRGNIYDLDRYLPVIAQNSAMTVEQIIEKSQEVCGDLSSEEELPKDRAEKDKPVPRSSKATEHTTYQVVDENTNRVIKSDFASRAKASNYITAELDGDEVRYGVEVSPVVGE